MKATKSNKATTLREAILSNVSRMGPECRACTLGRDEMDLIVELRGRVPPTPYGAISTGLRSIGINVSTASISRHFREGHGRK